MSKRRTAGAIVRLTIEVKTESWGPECTLDQVTKQAKEDAVDTVRKAVESIKAAYKITVRSIDGVRVVLDEEELP